MDKVDEVAGMFRRGASKRAIAAALKISEAEVMKCLVEANKRTADAQKRASQGSR